MLQSWLALRALPMSLCRDDRSGTIAVMFVGHPWSRSMTSTETGRRVLDLGGYEHGGLCVSAVATT